MGVMLVFACPETGREAPVCILRGGQRLKDLQASRFQFACMECGQTHWWAIGEGRLALGEAEPPRAPQTARIL